MADIQRGVLRAIACGCVAIALVAVMGARMAAQGPITYYLSEGATGAFFDEDILIANPNDAAAAVTLTFSKENGEQIVATRSIAARSHLTVRVDQITGLDATIASAQVRSDNGLPLLVERTMFWDRGAYAGHTGAAVDLPAQDWYFAEGSQGFFSTYVLVINPQSSPVDVTFTFLREREAPVTTTVTVGPSTRYTLGAGDLPELHTRSFGIAVHATAPVMAERAMYFGTTPERRWSGGTESAGVTAASRKWFLAEGATGAFFDTFVLLSNPQSTPASVSLQFLLDNGASVTVPKRIAPNTRLTVNIEDEADERLRGGPVSTVVTSDVPIIAERSMYWPRGAMPWGEGHNSFGVTEAGTRWGLAEGRLGGPLGFHTYILLANAESTAANVTVTYLRENGAPPIVRSHTVNPTSRYSIDTATVENLRDQAFGAVIDVANDIPIVVERSMYWNADGIRFAAGTNGTGIRLADTTDPGGPAGCSNLVADPGFELGLSGFSAQDASSSVTRASDSPLAGAHSLRVAINGYGNNVWWRHGFAGGRARHLTVRAHLRSDEASASQLRFCAMAYYQDSTSVSQCTAVSGATGDKGEVSAAVDIDPSKRLEAVTIRLSQEGSAPVRFSLDTVGACLDVVEAPPDGGGGGGGGGDGGGGGGGGGGTTCGPTTGPTAYPGYTYQLPAARPFVSLADYDGVNRGSTAYTRFKRMADDAIAGHPAYGYSATHAVIMYRLTNEAKYIDDAIARVEQQVQAAEQAIAGGGRPPLSGDSYLEVGWYLEQLALAYDYGYDRLTPSQRQRWASLADQALYNVWNPDRATWGGAAHPWSGWATCDPGNNYHYSFLKATMLWSLASKNLTWIQFLQTHKFPRLIDYYAALPGGGTREGTGYGTALNNLFANYRYWKSSTGEDLAALTPHPRETMDYWLHATVPTFDRFAPIGDLSRESVPRIYDYHENLVHEAVALAGGSSDQARRGTWWLQQNSVNGVRDAFNLAGDLLPYPATAAAPSTLVYHATGAGAFFARSSWTPDAAWFAFIAGKYDQSHAHHDQGSFTFFKGDWLAVTPNIWSHSGIHQEDEVHNVLRFARGNGSTIPQNPSDAVQSSMTYTNVGGVVTVSADLANAYSNNRASIGGWTRQLTFAGQTLRVHDVCSVAAGVTPIFQLQTPVAPVQQGDGSIVAGALRIVPRLPVTASWTNLATMAGGDFSQGYRIELRSAGVCEFDVDLIAQ